MNKRFPLKGTFCVTGVIIADFFIFADTLSLYEIKQTVALFIKHSGTLSIGYPPPFLKKRNTGSTFKIKTNRFVLYFPRLTLSLPLSKTID
jgi:hypothetical protein